MGKRFVICFGMIFLMLVPENYAWAQEGNYMAGFDIRWIQEYEPPREDGVTTVGEPDWDAEPETAGCAVAAGELAADLGQMLLAEVEDKEDSEAPGTVSEAEEEDEEGEWVSLGDDWVITYYCPLSCCNGPWAWQMSTEGPMQFHHTIAVDPSVIPYYTHVRIGGLDYEYVAEDCGGGIKGKRIDVLVENCTIARSLGVDRNVEVWVKK